LVNRGAASYQMTLPAEKGHRVGTRALALIRPLSIAKDRRQMRQLSRLAPSVQLLVARRLQAGKAETVGEAEDAIFKGAPVDSWSEAYVAVMKLSEPDRVRMFRWILERGDFVKVCRALLAEDSTAEVS
jgi:hypothetical protein